jgi:multiple sugar transport system permease protein
VTLEQYREILWESPFYLNMFWNSVRIVLPVVLGQLAVSALAAYAFTVLRFRGKEGLFLLYIVVMLLPLQVTLVPNYIVADALGLETSELAIVLPGVFNPLGVFLLRQYMKLLPAAYLESAMIDGANHGTAFLRVALPMALPGLACVALLTFIDYWNLIDQAVIFLRDAAKQPLSLFLARINELRMGVSFAGAVFYASPVLIVLYFGQEYLKRGISLSGLKG